MLQAFSSGYRHMDALQISFCMVVVLNGQCRLHVYNLG